MDDLLEQLKVTDDNLRLITYKLNSQIIKKNDKFLKTRNFQTVAAAIIVFASRIHNNPISARKLTKFVEFKEKTLTKIFRHIKDNYSLISGNANIPQPKIFVEKIVQGFQNNLEMSEELKKKIIQGSELIL